MIKTALKHWIYEICIEQLFNAITNNFNFNNQKFKVGDRFDYIRIEDASFGTSKTFHDVIITEYPTIPPIRTEGMVITCSTVFIFDGDEVEFRKIDYQRRFGIFLSEIVLYKKL